MACRPARSCTAANPIEEGEERHEVAGINLRTRQPANCPDASKVANVRIKTPLLEHELTGVDVSGGAAELRWPAGKPVLLAESRCTWSLKNPNAGVLVKLAGKVTPDPVTGQLTTTFENTPQLPFTELKAEFFGTDRAPLATPALCGDLHHDASFTPWSATPRSTRPRASRSPRGPAGSACSNPLPFSPSLASGTTNINAGAFSPLTTTLTREDGQQSIRSVVLHYPPGVSLDAHRRAVVPGSAGERGHLRPGKLIGETIVSVGLGNDPFTVTGGKVYLTETYQGAPFGLIDRQPREGGPVRPAGRPPGGRQREDRNRPAHRRLDGHDRGTSRRSSKASRCRSSTST